MLKKSTIFFLLTLTFFFSQVNAAPLLLPERTVTCEREPFITQLKYGDHTQGCSISEITDRDTLTFEGVVDEKVTIIVVSTSTNMDPRLELRGPDGTILDTGACNNKGCYIRMEHILPETGTYFMIISEGGVNETGNYQVQLERIPPTSPPLSISIPYEFPGNDGINTLTDFDFITFEGTAGTEIDLTVVSTTTNMDPQLVVWDPDGEVIFEGYCLDKGCNIPVPPQNLTISGVYLMQLHDRSFNESGGYRVEISCSFPPDACPDDLDRDFIIDALDICIRVANTLQEDMDEDELGDLCDADLNNDGFANSTDLGVFAENFGIISSEIIPHEGDFDVDEDSDGEDLSFLIKVGIGTFGPSGLVR